MYPKHYCLGRQYTRLGFPRRPGDSCDVPTSQRGHLACARKGDECLRYLQSAAPKTRTMPELSLLGVPTREKKSARQVLSTFVDTGLASSCCTEKEPVVMMRRWRTCGTFAARERRRLGANEDVRAPNTVIGEDARESARSTSSDNSPECICTLSRGRPGARMAAASLDPTKELKPRRCCAGKG